MATQSFNHVITNAANNEEIYECKGWVHMVAILEAAAGGENTIKTNGNFAKIDPGKTINIVLEPGTKISVKTTSTANVQWAIFITELEMVDQILGALCQIGGA